MYPLFNEIRYIVKMNIIPKKSEFKKNDFHYRDFSAILSFISSIMVLYVAYIQIQHLLITTTGMDLNTLPEDVKSKVVSMMDEELKQMPSLRPSEQLSFFEFMYQSLTSLRSNVVVHDQVTQIQIVIRHILNHSMVQFQTIATRHCMPNADVVLDESFMGFGKIVNYIVNAGVTYSSASETSACVMKTAEIYSTTTMNLFFQRLNASASQISGTISIASKLGVASIVYLSHRIYHRICASNSVVVKNIENTT